MAIIYKSIILFITLSLFCGCMPFQADKTQAKLLDMPDLQLALNIDPQSEKILQEWPHEQWWQAFNNPELNRLLDTALQNNPGLNAAVARLNQAEAFADYQAATLLPIVTSNAELHHRRFSATDFYGANGGKTFTGAYLDAAVFRYHLDLWGKDKAALEAALGKERAQVSELAMARLLLSTALTRSYFQLCTSEEDIELSHALKENAEALLHLVRSRWQGGLTSQDQLFVAEQFLETAIQQETGKRTHAQKLRNLLATLAGQGPDWGIAITTGEFLLTTGLLPVPQSLSLGLLAHRPDVAAARWRVESAAQLIKIAKTNFYPDINLTGFAGLRSLKLEELFLSHGASLAYGIGPTLTLPIFEGGRLEAELKKQQAAYDAAAENYNEILLSAVQQVADSLAEWQKAQSDHAAQERALLAAKAAYQLSAMRYAAGISTQDESIEAAATLLKQQLAASAIHHSQAIAAVGLIEALGGGYQSTQAKADNHD